VASLLAESLQAESLQAESLQAESLQAESLQAESLQAESLIIETLAAHCESPSFLLWHDTVQHIPIYYACHDREIMGLAPHIR
jgi:hypothetical protein